ncbi:MAG TPA: hypothetical protein DCM87_06720 [Planctomycetes bacterium]|nr:hypothetical protein [Planctomycetota bacterium]
MRIENTNGCPAGERRFTPAVWGAVMFTAAYLGLAVPRALVTGNTEFVIYIVVVVVLVAVIGGVHLKVGLTAGVLWAMSFWGLAHMAGGLVSVPTDWPTQGDYRVLYSLWLIPDTLTGGRFALKYDQVVHAYGFGVTTWLCWQGLRAALRARCQAGAPAAEPRPTFGLLVLCAAAGMGFGGLNEVVEFAATLVTETNVGGYENTGWDLVSNAVGAAVAACLIRRHGK